jgi:hypothetical protein
MIVPVSAIDMFVENMSDGTKERLGVVAATLLRRLRSGADGALALRDGPRGGQRVQAGAALRGAYRLPWLCGGVSVNHKTLVDFRVGQGPLR